MASASECVMVTSVDLTRMRSACAAAPPCNRSCGGPEHAARVTGPQRLHCRLFRRESAREVGYGISPTRTIGNLPFGKDTAQETLAIPFQGGADPGNVGGIESKSEDIHGVAPA